MGKPLPVPRWIPLLPLLCLACVDEPVVRPPAPLAKGARAPAAPRLPADASLPPETHPGVEAQRRSLRKRSFARQRARRPLKESPDALLALWPKDLPARITGVGVQEEMTLTRPEAGFRRIMVRWVTWKHGEALLKPLREHLKAQGWSPITPGLAGTLRHPLHGTLELRIEMPEERENRVEAWLRVPPARAGLSPPERYLSRPPKWMSELPGERIGFEYDHFHGTRPDAAFTEAERWAEARRVADPAAWVKKAHALLRSAGYATKDPTGQAWRHPDGSRFLAEVLEGAVVLHHQRRWKAQERVRPKH